MAVCVRALQMCARKTSHSARLFRQQSRASFMLALCLRAVLISSPDTWDWTRMHALVVMHRRTLCENVDSAKIKVTFYTTDIDILRVALMHRIVIHRIDPYRWIVTHPYSLIALMNNNHEHKGCRQSHLLDAETEVKKAVWSIALPIGSTHLFDKVR